MFDQRTSYYIDRRSLKRTTGLDDLWATKSEDVGIIDRTVTFQIFNLPGVPKKRTP